MSDFKTYIGIVHMRKQSDGSFKPENIEIVGGEKDGSFEDLVMDAIKNTRGSINSIYGEWYSMITPIRINIFNPIASFPQDSDKNPMDLIEKWW